MYELFITSYPYPKYSRFCEPEEAFVCKLEEDSPKLSVPELESCDISPPPSSDVQEKVNAKASKMPTATRINLILFIRNSIVLKLTIPYYRPSPANLDLPQQASPKSPLSKKPPNFIQTKKGELSFTPRLFIKEPSTASLRRRTKRLKNASFPCSNISITHNIEHSFRLQSFYRDAELAALGHMGQDLSKYSSEKLRFHGLIEN